MVKHDENIISPTVLPIYKNPPLNEVICGMRFLKPDSFKLPHIGLLWDKLQGDYPNIQHAPPIAEKGNVLIDVEAGGILWPRVWFINNNDDQLVQFQFDRFYFNWRRRQNTYPHYDFVFKHFNAIFNIITDIFKNNKLGELTPVEYELSYVNHIIKGEGWNSFDDILKVFSDFTWESRKDRFLPTPINISWITEFPLPDNNGRLSITLKQAVRRDDNISLFVLELRAIKTGLSIDTINYHNWYNLAHQWIVQGFTDITTQRIQKYWGREK